MFGVDNVPKPLKTYGPPRQSFFYPLRSLTRLRLVTRWNKDPYSLGSYAVPSFPFMREFVAVLAADIEKKLFFAGEVRFLVPWICILLI